MFARESDPRMPSAAASFTWDSNALILSAEVDVSSLALNDQITR